MGPDDLKSKRILEGARKGGAATAERRREISVKVASFRAALAARTDASDPIKAVLVDSAVALYAQIVPRTFFRPTVRGRVRANESQALSACITSLRSVLGELGLMRPSNESDGPPPADSPLEVRQKWSREYVARVMAESREDRADIAG